MSAPMTKVTPSATPNVVRRQTMSYESSGVRERHPPFGGCRIYAGDRYLFLDGTSH